jgi:hypothetical protein
MAIKRRNKADIEAGRIRVTGFLKKSEYKNLVDAMELLGIHNEATYVTMSIVSFNQHTIGFKNKKPSPEENG